MHGIPKRIQSDNDGEFKKHVKKFCEKMKIKMVRYRRYHPQFKGKGERSHRVLRNKIHYDMSREKKHGVNWAKELQDYARYLNNENREELTWKSPFEIYYGRKSYDLVNPGLKYEGSVSTLRSLPPKQKDVKAHLDTVNK